MASKIVHTCTAPDGTVFKRVSASGRKYTHAIIGQRESGEWFGRSWHSRRDLAQRELPVGNYRVVDARAEEKAVSEKPEVEFPAIEFERDGIVFKIVDDHRFAAQATYRGHTIELNKRFATFTGSTWPGPNRWEGAEYVKSGNLESRIKALKAIVDKREEAGL